MNNADHFYAPDRAAWRQWLVDNHETATSVWLVMDKGTDRKLTWPDLVQEALCFGWIDSKAVGVSDTQTKIYVSKRKPKSVWSKINKDHVERLITNGLMQPAGLASIDVAKQNGAWDALNKSDALELPPEMIAMLEVNHIAHDNFSNFSVSARRMILAWIYSAKRPETYETRIRTAVEQAEQNIKAVQ